MAKVSTRCPLHAFIQGNPISHVCCHCGICIHFAKVMQAAKQGGKEARRQGGKEARRQGGKEARRQGGKEASRQEATAP
jgi:hypothetical protein